ncbi:organic hydroperoxide resistance protein OhrR [soil metagenome]
MQPLYTAEATATGGREGRASSSDGVLDLALAVPKEMGGPGGDATNPEQLFAAGYAACFHSALTLVARREREKVEGSSVTADVGIGQDGGGFGLAVELKVALPGVERDTAEALVAKAHEVCPYSKATRGNIEVTLTVSDPSV